MALTSGFSASLGARVPGDSQEVVVKAIDTWVAFLLDLGEICTNLHQTQEFTICGVHGVGVSGVVE